MTRINVVEPAILTDQHLLAEYRELPRVFSLARASQDHKGPPTYTMGAGHVRFFYPRTEYLSARQGALINECLRRGFKISYTEAPAPVPGSLIWRPDAAAIRVNRERLQARLREKPGLYTYFGSHVGPDFYGDPQV